MTSEQSERGVLKLSFDREIDALCRDVDAFPWENRDAYVGWLINSWAYVRHTTRVTALAAARLPESAEGLHERLLRHAVEEYGHEKLLVEDLQKLGVTPNERDVLPITTAFAQCLYYQIAYVSPFALFGRVLPLEGVSAMRSANARARVEKAHGAGADAFLRVHGDADPAHIAEAFEALANVDSRETAIIEEGMRLTGALYRSMLSGIVASLRR